MTFAELEAPHTRGSLTGAAGEESAAASYLPPAPRPGTAWCRRETAPERRSGNTSDSPSLPSAGDPAAGRPGVHQPGKRCPHSDRTNIHGGGTDHGSLAAGGQYVPVTRFIFPD